MKTKIRFLISMVFLAVFSVAFAQRPTFNKSKDILIAQFDSKPDPDDIHAQAALGSMLLHNDLKGVNYFAVSGAVGKQGGKFIDSRTLFDMAFGKANWTAANVNWRASVTQIKNKVIPILQNGGKVWVQEAGQSNITRDWLVEVLKSVAPNTVKNNVIVVQHSTWNENHTDNFTNKRVANPAILNFVKNNSRYFLLDDGNFPSNSSNPNSNNGPWSTPQYQSNNRSLLTRAKNSPNIKARNIWREADRIIQVGKHLPSYSVITRGGVDYSDCVENWWILGIGNNANNNDKFWNRYVTNTTGINPNPGPGGSNGGNNNGGNNGNNNGGGNPLAVSCSGTPSTIPAAKSITIPVTYTHNEAGNKDIFVVAFQNGAWKGNGSVKSVARGDNKTVNVTLNITTVPTGTGWSIKSIIRPTSTGFVAPDKECSKNVTFTTGGNTGGNNNGGNNNDGNNNGGNNGGGSTDGSFFIVNRQTGKKLAPQNNNDAAELIQLAANTTSNIAKWTQVNTSNGYFYLKNVSTGKYFRPATTADGSKLEQRPTSFAGNYTQWKQVNSSGGYFYLQNRQTNLYFRPNTDATNSTMVQRPTSYAGNYTQWKFETANGSAKNLDAEDKISIYPNPTIINGVYVTVGVSAIGSEIIINSIGGKLVAQGQASNTETYIDLAKLEKGVYLVNIIKNGKTLKTSKIIKN